LLRSGENPRLDLELNALSFIEIQIEIRDSRTIIKELN